jgi:hypothetical protein
MSAIAAQAFLGGFYLSKNMLDSLLQFGLGAALIGTFFIPFVLRLYKDNKQLNQELQNEKDKRMNDMKETQDAVLVPLREFNSVAQAILNLKIRGGHE